MTGSNELADFGKVLILAPHPDDEVLGCGGTMARLCAAGHEVHVAIVTKGMPPLFSEETVDCVRDELKASHKILGRISTHYLDLPAAQLDKIGAAEMNGAICRIVGEIQPDTLFVPFLGDIHIDHQLVFTSAMVACRPRSAVVPRRVLAYETLSETNWAAPPLTPGFMPNFFVDIEGYLDQKIAAFGEFASQVKAFPDERSFETIRALATLRGSTVYRRAAEAFILVRQIT